MTETLEQVEERMTKAGFRKVATVVKRDGDTTVTTPAYDRRVKYIRMFYCVSKACVGVQLDDKIKYIMDGPDANDAMTDLIDLMEKADEYTIGFEGERRSQTNDEIFAFFEALA